MRQLRTACILIPAAFLAVPLQLNAWADPAVKTEAVASIEGQKDELIRLSDRIWSFAETALRETRSAEELANYAEKNGFVVQRGVAGMPTAFIASYGKGRPIIGILGEYDALPGISQKAQPTQEPLVAGTPGHGCGHNLFGAASLGASVAIKNLIAAGKLKGTIRFYGTPAEEAVGGKVYMAREGLFKDLDVCLAWHPDDETEAGTDSSQALVDFIVEFKGRTAHAAYDPWNGRSALHGVEAFLNGVNMLRENVKPSVRIHYTIVRGGDVPNVVPDYAKVWCWVRDSTRGGVDQVLERVRQIAAGAALIAGVESRITIQAGDYETLVNLPGQKLLQANLEWLGPVPFTEEEQEFARSLQRATGVEPRGLDGKVQPMKAPQPDPPGGSTDVGDVSWVVPTLQFVVTTAPKNAPWHAWPVVACSGMSIGHKGMLYAAKTLAATAVDLLEAPETLTAIQTEFKEKTKGVVYKPYVPDGPPPVPKP
jgi:aminobenzoyl-glutamate utilization protein B